VLHRPAAYVLAALVTCTVLGACSGDDDDARAANETSSTGASTTPSTTSSTTSTSVPGPDLAAARVALTQIAGGFESPVALAVRPGDDRLYVAEQSGRVRIVENAAPLDPPVFEVDVSTGNEQGLLGLTFSSDGARLYVDYTDPAGNTHVDEYAMDDDVVDPASRRELLFVEQPFANHNGGQVIFGPDGMLYVGLGDGGSGGDPRGNGQRTDTLLGKILRIDPRPSAGSSYTIPPDNPFVGRADARPEIWMYGLRNPWRFTFDRDTDDVWIGDVGQNAWEEIDFTTAADAAGSNWGWNPREGAHDFAGNAPAGVREPIFELSHGDGNCSVTGGYVYRGERIPALRGAYVFADFCRGELTALVQRDGALAEQALLGPRSGEVTSFGEDAAGELYVLTRSGAIYRIDPA
jgi:glucose/arabinose dehydrogenase